MNLWKLHFSVRESCTDSIQVMSVSSDSAEAGREISVRFLRQNASIGLKP